MDRQNETMGRGGLIEKENSKIGKAKDLLTEYKQALEQALGKKVKRIYIYSVYLGKEIEIK